MAEIKKDQKKAEEPTFEIITFEELASSIDDSDRKEEEKEVLEEIKSLEEGVEKKDDFLSMFENKEDVKEENKEEVIDKEKESGSEKPILESTMESDSYTSILKELFGETVSSIRIEEDGEEKEVSIDDVVIDKDMFIDIYKQSYDAKKEEILKGMVSTEGVSDFTLKLMEIDKKGGKVDDLYQAKTTFIDRLNNLNLEETNGQKEVVYLELKAKGSSDDDAQDLVDLYESKGVLKDKANQAEQNLRKAMEDALAKRLEHVEKVKEEEERKLQMFRDEMKSNIDQTFELSDHYKKKVLDAVTKKDKDGNVEIDYILREELKDPSKAAKIALLLLNEEEFIKQISNKEVIKEKLETARKAGIVLKSRGSGKPIVVQRKERKDEQPISFDYLSTM